MKKTLSLLSAVLCAAPAAAQLIQFEKGAPSPKELVESLRAGAAKMRPAAFSMANALPAAPPEPQDAQDPPPAQDGYFDRFHAIEADLLAADQRFSNAPSGSDEEADARDQRQRAVDRGAELAAQQDWLSLYAPQDIETFAKEAADKYQAAAAGSFPESFYKQFIPLAWQAYETSSERAVRAAGHWRKVVDAADLYEQRYQAAAAGSNEEAAFKSLRAFAWETAPKTLERQLKAAFGSFRAFEAMASEFENGYQAAASGSDRETFYNKARVLAYDAAYREASRALSESRDPGFWSSIDQEYDARAQSAPANSPALDYYAKVRDLARRLGQQP